VCGLLESAPGRNRTGTRLTPLRILSPVCLPISPPEQVGLKQETRNLSQGCSLEKSDPSAKTTDLPFVSGETALRLVLFDDQCALCRMLAHFMQARSGATFQFLSLADFRRQEPGAEALSDSLLTVITPAGPLSGEAAWEELLRTLPDLRSLSWLAERLGFSRAAGRALNAGGTALRRLCFTCPR